MMQRGVFRVALLVLALSPRPGVAEAPAALPLMPWPAEMRPGAGALPIGLTLTVSVEGGSPLLDRALARFTRRLSGKGGGFVRLAHAEPGGPATLRVVCAARDPRFLTLEADESYALDVTPNGAELRAAGETGVVRGLATLAQLARKDGAGLAFAAASVRDRPRFPWRGLMIDPVRHFVPFDDLARQLDAMEAVKLNVLHLHLSDSEAYRVESRVRPLLHEKGSDGLFYTQAQVRQLVERARDRGIRVVPELDAPSHTRSWLVGYPEIATKPQAYRTGFDRATRDVTIDPTREETYAFLDALVGELASLFPDRFLHLGGDEVVDPEWATSPAIQAFMKANGLADRHALHAHFSRRAAEVVARHGRIAVGWDEVLDHGLPPDAVVQTWRSSKLAARSTATGRRTLVSAGYYLDWVMPPAYHYAIDPADPSAYGLSERERAALASTALAPFVTEANVVESGATLTPAQEALLLGGEAALWSECVEAPMLDGRLWPRTAAIAERLWSPRDVRDPVSMERRLIDVGRDLAALGLRHEANRRAMLARLAPGAEDAAFALGTAVAPSRFYSRIMARMRGTPEALRAPFDRLADAATPDSPEAARFALDVHDLVAAGEKSGPRVERLRAQLAAWRDARASLEKVTPRSPALAEALPVAADLEAMAAGGMAALDAWQAGARPPAEAVARAASLAEHHAKAATPVTSFVLALGKPLPPAEVVVLPAPAIGELLAAAGVP